MRPSVVVVKQPPFWPRKGLPGDWIKGQCVCVIDMHPCASNQHRLRPLLAHRHAGLKAKGSFQMHTEWEDAGHIPSKPSALAKVMVWVALMIPDSGHEWRHTVQAKAASPLPTEHNFYNVYHLNVLGRNKGLCGP